MINKNVNTSCKNCVFAIYDDITQTDCELNLIEKYRGRGIDIVDAYDEEKEFFIINNMKCSYLRTSSWSGASKTLEERQGQAHGEIQIRFHVIIRAKNNLEDIKKTLDSLVNQSLKPYYITIVREAENTINAKELIQLCEDTKIQWRIENLLEPIESLEKTLDLFLPFVKTKVYTVYNAGFEVPKDTLRDISREAIDNLRMFLMILPNSEGNGLAALSEVHKSYINYPGETLQEKLEKDECPAELLVPICNLLSYFPK